MEGPPTKVQRCGETKSREVVKSKRQLMKLGIIRSSDGSLVRDGDFVYVLLDPPPVAGRLLQIDYFHGIKWGEPMAQMMDNDETDVMASEMIAVKFIAALWRTWFEQTKSGKASLRRRATTRSHRPTERIDALVDPTVGHTTGLRSIRVSTSGMHHPR